MAPFRRVLRRLLLPVFTRLSEILGDVCRRLDDGDHARDALNLKLDQLNGKFDGLNLKLDQLNAKFDGLNLKFGALTGRQDALGEDVAAVVALNWDHTAIARRLGQLEDRFVALGEAADDSLAHPSIRFPGLEHYEPPAEGRTAADGPSAGDGPQSQAG
jgi:hypothetical protein